MNEIEISKIKKDKNIRQDLGDLTSMTASIRENGVRDPVELSKKNILIDGYRRLASAIAAGKKTIPYFYGDGKLHREESQLIAGIYQKNLNPIEEAKAFQDYIKRTKRTTKHLAKKLGKQENYIDRRLALNKTSKATKEAMLKGKISLGHAVVLSRVDPDQEKKLLKELSNEDMTVRTLTLRIDREKTADLGAAPFKKKDCKGCEHNGGCQTLLSDIGNALKNSCLKTSCYWKKVDMHIADEKEKLLKSGVNVISVEVLNDLSYKKHIRSWDDEFEQAKRTIFKNKDKKPDTYAVCFKKDHTGFPQLGIYLINKPETKPTSTTKAASKLDSKVDEYKRNFLIAITRNRLDPKDAGIKTLALWTLFEKVTTVFNKDEEELNKILPGIEDQFWGKNKAKKAFSISSENLDKAMSILCRELLKELPEEVLQATANNFGLDMKKDFVLTSDYLKLHTIDELKKLSIEFGWTVSSSKKKEIIESFLEQWKPGEVPKVLQ